MLLYMWSRNTPNYFRKLTFCSVMMAQHMAATATAAHDSAVPSSVDGDADKLDVYGGGATMTISSNVSNILHPPSHIVPPHTDASVPLPSVEWWDEVFLPKSLRESRRLLKIAPVTDIDGEYSQLSLLNNKTHKYIQHPVPIKPLGGDKPEQPLPMYLTKKERKKLRKSTRALREQEKRDKMMMGLIPAPEPKFKLSNFMKVYECTIALIYTWCVVC